MSGRILDENEGVIDEESQLGNENADVDEQSEEVESED